MEIKCGAGPVFSHTFVWVKDIIVRSNGVTQINQFEQLQVSGEQQFGQVGSRTTHNLVSTE